MVVKYFSWIKEHIGKAEDVIDLPADITTIKDLITYLENLNDDYRLAFEKKNLIKSDIDSIETSAQIKIFNNGLLPLDQSILSSRFLCLADALNGPRKKNMPNELIAKSPKKKVLKSTIYFLILPRVLAFLSRAKSK